MTAGTATGAVLPGWIKLAYGLGAGGWVLVDRIVLTWLYYFYITAPETGVQALLPLAFAALMFGGRVVDALADPIVARLSDNHAGRWGRRVPFMAASGVAYVGAYVALFNPPVTGRSVWNVAYLALLLACYFVLFTAYVGPYLALLADLSRTTGDRVDLSTSKAVFTLVGAAVALIGSGILIETFGIHGMVWALGAVALLLLYVPVAIPERRYAVARPATLRLVESIRTTFRNRPFLTALVGVNALWFGFNIVTLNIPLYVTSLLGRTEGDVALFMAAVFGVALVTFPAANLLAKRQGLKFAMVASLLLFATCFPFLYALGEPLLGMSPLVFGLVLMGFAGIPLAGFFIVPDAMVATVSDLELELSGQRREAMYFGVQGLLLKLNLGVSTLVSAALLQGFGDPLGIRLTGPVAALVILAGAVVFTRFPEREVEARRIRLLAVGAETVPGSGTAAAVPPPQ